MKEKEIKVNSKINILWSQSFYKIRLKKIQLLIAFKIMNKIKAICMKIL